MISLQTPQEFSTYTGQSLGVSDWMNISQMQISDFARLTGDDHWIHVDTKRAEREMPDGKTIAHGLFILSLIPLLQRQLFQIERRGTGLNYGYDKVRFTAPVQQGAQVRLQQSVYGAKPRGQGTQIELTSTIEIKDGAKPALVAHCIILVGNPA